MNRRPHSGTAAVAALAVPFLLVLVLAPTLSSHAAGDDAERGERLFRLHCASCHGADATGTGPMAEFLNVPPADLTAIAAAAGGTFPKDRVFGAIDGRTHIRGHGTSTMPVWGLSFQDEGRDSDQEAETRARIDALVAYIATLQVAAKETAAP